MTSVSQTGPAGTPGSPARPAPKWIVGLAALSLIPVLIEAYAVLWGARRGYTGRALRDGLDFWTGGRLAITGRVWTVFDPVAYRHFIAGVFGPALPTHLWSYPPSYLLLAAAFARLPPWPAVLGFDLASLALLVLLLRLAGRSWPLILAVAASPAALENAVEGQNAALITALIGGGLLLLETRPRLAGVLIGLATVKPQLGLPLPARLLRSPAAFGCAALSALILMLAARLAFGPHAWAAFWQVTRPAMSNVLLTGRPRGFAAGLISVFAAVKPFLGVQRALALQFATAAGAVWLAARTRNPAILLILCALASPYLHGYDLLGVTLAVALLAENRFVHGFHRGELPLFMLCWIWPGELPWMPLLMHGTPVLLLLLLATALRHDRIQACESRKMANPLLASSAGP